jgi:hypothetical protein
VKVELVPASIGEANAFVDQFHEHHRPTVSGLFAVAVATGETVRGVAIVGRPVSRHLQDGFTAEVNRLAVNRPWADAAKLGWAAGLWFQARERGLRGLAHAQWVLERMSSNPVAGACSALYAACWRAARALGYRRLVTYTLNTEPGTSLRAAGWRMVGETRGGSWSSASRPRVDKHPTQGKFRWEAPT